MGNTETGLSPAFRRAGWGGIKKNMPDILTLYSRTPAKNCFRMAVEGREVCTKWLASRLIRPRKLVGSTVKRVRTCAADHKETKVKRSGGQKHRRENACVERMDRVWGGRRATTTTEGATVNALANQEIVRMDVRKRYSDETAKP